MSTRTGALDTLVFGVDVQSGDVRGSAPSYALVVFDGAVIERNVVSRRKLLRQIAGDTPDIVATDNMFELVEDKDELVRFLRSLPTGTRLVQVTGAERPESLSRVASRHGVPYGKNAMQEAEAAARLAAKNVGYEVSAFTDTTQVKVSRGRTTGKGGWSEDRYTRRIHGAVQRRSREVAEQLDDAGLSYDLKTTEKYGGLANAVFTVGAPPGDLPVSARRAKDVRVEIEPVRRDGIEFRPLAKRRDPVVVGVDPGTTTAVAVTDLDGSPLDVMSTRTADTAAVIEWIVERGRPVVVAADVEPMPNTVEKIRRSFDAAGWTPTRDLPVDDKLHRTRDVGYENDHERDALAAALFACDANKDRFARIMRKLPPSVDIGTVIPRVLSGNEPVEAVIADLEPEEDHPPEEPAPPPAEISPEQQRVRALERRISRLESHIDDLESTVEDKNREVDEYENALTTARREERREARERRIVTRLERANDRLERELESAREEISTLEGKLERLKELWRLDHSNFADVAAEKQDLVSVKPVRQFTLDAIEQAHAAYGLIPGDVIYLRDASGAGPQTARRLAEIEPRVILRDGGLSEAADEILFDHRIPVGPADDVVIEEIDELAVARERDIERVIADWGERAEARVRSQNEAMMDRLISEHRSRR